MHAEAATRPGKGDGNDQIASDDFNPLFVADQAQQWFVIIHLFSDGNGRTAHLCLLRMWSEAAGGGHHPRTWVRTPSAPRTGTGRQLERLDEALAGVQDDTVFVDPESLRASPSGILGWLSFYEVFCSTVVLIINLAVLVFSWEVSQATGSGHLNASADAQPETPGRVLSC